MDIEDWDDEMLSTNEDGIDIEIDEITPCLRNQLTGELVDTFYLEVNKPILQKEFKDWNFNWSLPQRDGYKIFQLFVKDSPEVQGQVAFKVRDNSVHITIIETAPHNFGHNGKYSGVGGHLFAIACQYSLDHGCDGYVDFISKSNLMNYYRDKIGAKYAGGQSMYLDTNDAIRLINKYLKKEE